MVGVTTFCNYPPAADALPEVGGMTAKTISVEAIVDLTPDLVIAGADSQQPVVEALGQLGHLRRPLAIQVRPAGQYTEIAAARFV